MSDEYLDPDVDPVVSDADDEEAPVRANDNRTLRERMDHLEDGFKGLHEQVKSDAEERKKDLKEIKDALVHAAVLANDNKWTRKWVVWITGFLAALVLGIGAILTQSTLSQQGSIRTAECRERGARIEDFNASVEFTKEVGASLNLVLNDTIPIITISEANHKGNGSGDAYAKQLLEAQSRLEKAGNKVTVETRPEC